MLTLAGMSQIKYVRHFGKNLGKSFIYRNLKLSIMIRNNIKSRRKLSEKLKISR